MTPNERVDKVAEIWNLHVDLRAQIKKHIEDAAADALAEQHEKLDAAHEVLRSLACWLSVGGYNADTVDAAVFERKIRAGVDALVAVEVNRAQGPRLSDTEEMALLRRTNAELTGERDAAIAKAVQEEREACAAIPESGRFIHQDAPDAIWARKIASMIRQRSQPPADPPAPVCRCFSCSEPLEEVAGIYNCRNASCLVYSRGYPDVEISNDKLYWTAVVGQFL